MQKVFLRSIFLICFFCFVNSGECFVSDGNKKEDKEEISATLKNELLEVYIKDNLMIFKGEYLYESILTSDMLAPISFPFYVDETHPFPEDIEVSNVTVLTSKSKILGLTDNSVEYLTVFKKQGTTKLIIRYKQILKEPKAVYLLTTNREKIPLKALKIYIYISDTYKEVKISYKYKKTEKREDYILYYIEEKDIIPDKNLIIEWKEK